MNYSEIHQALVANNLTWSIAADAIGCSESHLINVAARRGQSKDVAQKLSALIGKDVAEVFPDKPRYQVDKKAERASKLSAAKARLEEAGLISASAA